MKDKDFKILNHSCEHYTVHSSGKQIEKNYSPDYVLKSDNSFIIIEHETEPNRKTILADIFKAAVFLSDKKKGVLIIVMTPKGSSSFESYPKHALLYFKWLKNKTNLEDVIFVHQSHYYNKQTVLVIHGAEFQDKSTSLNSLIQV